MGRPRWFVEIIEKAFPSRFFFARMTHLPLIGRLVDFSLFNGDELIYLPRDRTIPIHEHIGNPGNIVLPSQVVAHFIEKASYHWIMNFCLCRESESCQDYPIDHGCLFLGEAVLKINPDFGRLVTKEEALAHVQRCREAGLVHMIGRNKLDSIWLGVKPVEKLLTICNCCPCCCLWRILPTVHPIIADKVERMPGVTVSINPENCTICGICTDGVCFADAILLTGNKVKISDDCRTCGRCVEACPNGAIELTITDDSYVQKTIHILTDMVDIN